MKEKWIPFSQLGIVFVLFVLQSFISLIINIKRSTWNRHLKKKSNIFSHFSPRNRASRENICVGGIMNVNWQKKKNEENISGKALIFLQVQWNIASKKTFEKLVRTSGSKSGNLTQVQSEPNRTVICIKVNGRWRQWAIRCTNLLGNSTKSWLILYWKCPLFDLLFGTFQFLSSGPHFHI